LKINELIHIFSQKTHNYYPQGLKDCKIKRNNSNRDKGVGHISSGKIRDTFLQTKTNYPKNIISFVPHNRFKVHPTQKPVALMEYLIKTYTNENELVLDFTFGSGTTGLACKNTNRNFIGIELDKEYFEIAKKRIEGAQDAAK